jgi:hypothetical protein
MKDTKESRYILRFLENLSRLKAKGKQQGMNNKAVKK